jgi:DNA-binding NtrC family response regulator
MAMKNVENNNPCVGVPVKVLIFEDEPDVALMLSRIVESVGDCTAQTHIGRERIETAIARAANVDLVFTDLAMPDLDGFEVIERIRQIDLDIPVVVVSAYSTIENAVQAIKAGAFDFLPKPFSPESVELVLAKLRRDRELRVRAAEMCRRAQEQDPYLHAILGQSREMVALREWICKVRGTGANVLIEGESGTGKELVARALHAGNGPFVALNMAAIPEDLAEAELFGVRAGAFTGATRDRNGLIARADGGVLFLDEIEAASPAIQAKLLRVLEDRAVRPLGGDRERRVEFRLICAGNACLEDMVRNGAFRRDLFHRLKVLHIRLAPLREHLSDIPRLAESFLYRYSSAHGRKIREISAGAMAALAAAHWPGNVRELENMIEQAVILCPDGQTEITADLFLTGSRLAPGIMTQPEETPADGSLKSVEERHIRSVLGQTGGNKSAAARILKIDYKTLLRKLAAMEPREKAMELREKKRSDRNTDSRK